MAVGFQTSSNAQHEMSEDAQIPGWVTADIFETALKQSVEGYKGVKSFKVFNALPPGENYVAMALKVEFQLYLQDNSLAEKTFFMKVAYNNELYNTQLYKWDVFTKERDAYKKFIPDFERMYRRIGIEVEFGPRSYDLPVKHEYLLLEDLSQRGFKNAIRQNGLDLQHCKAILKKLAQWHAASAVRVQNKGAYNDIYLTGSLNPRGEDLVRSMMTTALHNIVSVAKDLKDSHIYYEQLKKLQPVFMDFLMSNIDHNPREFNVLNHGDFWCNNMMFRYNGDGKLQQSLLVDYQLTRYGSPGHDLIHLLLSSTALELRTGRFDELLKYYHDNLVECLRLLEYSKPIPSLGDIQKMVTDAKAWAAFAAFSMIAVVFAEPTESASLDHLVGNSADVVKEKELILRQKSITKYLEVTLPWMYYRGHFEHK